MTPTLSAEEMDREVARTAPERIYLVIGGECPSDASFAELSEVTWCEDDVDGNGIEYVRARHPQPECGEVFDAEAIHFQWVNGEIEAGTVIRALYAARRLLAERDAKVEALTEYAAAVERSADKAEQERDQLRALLTAQPQAGAAQSAPSGEREAAVEAAYAAVVEGGWSSVKEMGVEMFQAGAAWQRAQSATAGAAPEGPNYKFKFETLVDHCKRQDQVIADLRYDQNIRRFYDDGAVWFWSGDDSDNLQTLACPVVINAGDLRAMLAAPQPAARQEQGDEVRRLREALELWLADYDEVAANPDFEPFPHVAERVAKSRAALSASAEGKA